MTNQDTIWLVIGLMLVLGLVIEDMVRRHKNGSDK